MLTGVCLSVRGGVGYLWSQVPSGGGGRVFLVPGHFRRRGRVYRGDRVYPGPPGYNLVCLSAVRGRVGYLWSQVPAGAGGGWVSLVPGPFWRGRVYPKMVGYLGGGK